MGQFVDRVKDINVRVWDPKEEILSVINDFRGNVEELQGKLNDNISNITNAVASYSPNVRDVNGDIPSVSLPSYWPSAPNVDLNLNEEWPGQDSIQDPRFLDVDADFSFQRPSAPDKITPEFDFTAGTYTQCTLQELCSIVKTSLASGGNGLTDVVYGLIIDRNRAARADAEERARRRAYNAVGSRGFDLAGGMAAAVVLEIEKETLAKDMDAVNSATIKDFELADSNTKFTKELALKVEELGRSSFDQEENRRLDVAKTTTSMVIEIYNSQIKSYIAEWEGVKSTLEAIKTKVDAVSKWNDSQSKKYAAEVDSYKAKIEAISSENESKTKVALSKAQIYDSEVKTIVARFNAEIEEMKAKVDKYRVEAGLAIESERLNLDSFTTSAQLAERAFEAAAKTTAQALASTLGGINTSLTSGFSGIARAAKSASVTNHLSESHQYTEE